MTFKVLKPGNKYRQGKNVSKDHSLIFCKRQRLVSQRREARRARKIPVEGTTLKSQEGRLLLPKEGFNTCIECCGFARTIENWKFIIRPNSMVVFDKSCFVNR